MEGEEDVAAPSPNLTPDSPPGLRNLAADEGCREVDNARSSKTVGGFIESFGVMGHLKETPCASMHANRQATCTSGSIRFNE